MRVEVLIVEEEIRLLLVPETKIDEAVLEEISKIESSETKIPIVRNDRGVVLRKDRRNVDVAARHLTVLKR